MKGKPLLPTLRTKKRYFVYEVIGSGEIMHNDVLKKINESYKNCFGVFGLSEAGIMDTRVFGKNRGIIKINHNCLEKLRISVSMIPDMVVQIVYVSGILKKAKIMLKGG
jgi:RNase P/RNase MRP subunit POP5